MTIKNATPSNKKLSINDLNRAIDRNTKSIVRLDSEIEPLEKTYEDLITKLGRLKRKSKSEGLDISDESETINTAIDKLEPQIKNLIDQRKELQREVMDLEDQLIVHDKENEWRKIQLLLKVKSYKDVYPLISGKLSTADSGVSYEQ